MRIGPPTLNPAWSRLTASREVPLPGKSSTKSPDSFQPSFVPCKKPPQVLSFEPCLVTMFSTPPEARPNSGANWCVSSTNSWITCCENKLFSVVPLIWSLLSRPSTRNEFDRPDWPLTTKTAARSP